MKKITFLMLFFAVSIGFSQTNRQIIQNHLDANRAKFGLSAQDVSDWAIQSEVPGSGTGITSTYIAQRYNGTEIFNVQNNVWVKNGAVLNMENAFLSNVASRVNATTPSLTALQAVEKAYANVNVSQKATFAISETKDLKNLTLTDGLQEDPITAKLVYQPTQDNKLKLAWEFQFYAPQGDAWDVRVDAINGIILEKNNLTINCSFENHNQNKTKKQNDFNFEKEVLKINSFAAVPGIPGTYRVIPFNYESPNHHAFELITTTGNLLASPNGWHDSNTETGNTAALRFTYTRGNNVWSKIDETGDDELTTAANVDGGTGLVFNFPYTNGISQTQQPSTYSSTATTNLFYMNNIMHDVWYQYGFNEISGNFQNKNLGRGGVVTGTGDYVLADSQDGVASAKTNPPFTATNKQNRNNANFSALADGVRPRMQMYMWDTGAPPIEYFTVNSPSIIAGGKIAKDNSFETTDHVPVPFSPGITSDLVLYNNTPVHVGQNGNSACAAASNPFDLSGKIALIRRGGCLFKDKVKNAQLSGAIAVIIMDSIPQSATYIGTLGMTSTGLTGITIPAISITKDLGETLVTQMLNGPVNITLQDPGNAYLFADGDFDNGIVSHEYAHGISNRLIGGPTVPSCMTNGEQMGEGWSDWFALMMQLKAGDVGTTARGIGTYAINEPATGGGIRSFPYSTDMGINPLTLVDSNVAEVHDRGEIWTAVLWDLTWAYINKYGLDPDVYNGTGGNNKVMRLVIDALKLQACNTASFISSRDKLIAADQATTGGADYCLITEVFRRRGMGLNASSGLDSDPLDQVEDFTAFPPGPNCTLATTYFNNDDMLRVSPNPSTGIYNIRINQFVGKLNIEVVDVNGRLILNDKNINFNTEKTINLSNFQSGIYILKITGENVNYSQKLIKN